MILYPAIRAAFALSVLATYWSKSVCSPAREQFSAQNVGKRNRNSVLVFRSKIKWAPKTSDHSILSFPIFVSTYALSTDVLRLTESGYFGGQVLSESASGPLREGMKIPKLARRIPIGILVSESGLRVGRISGDSKGLVMHIFSVENCFGISNSIVRNPSRLNMPCLTLGGRFSLSRSTPFFCPTWQMTVLMLIALLALLLIISTTSCTIRSIS